MPKKFANSTSIDPTTGPIHLTIFHTNDMHGRLEAMARLSSFARRLRAEAEAEGRQVFFWDAGDAADHNVRLCSLSKGAAFSPILNVMGYGLQTMGNVIPAAYGPQAIAAVASGAGFPILAANGRDRDGPLPEGLREYVVIPLPGGIKMGVIGLTTPWGFLTKDLEFHPPDHCTVTRDLAQELKDQGASLVIVLSHLGLEDDRCLAKTVTGIDVIIGAHSHDLLPPGEVCNNVLITQAGEYAETLGRVDMTLDPATGHVLSRTAQVLPVPIDEPADPDVLTVINAAEQLIDALMAQNIEGEAAPPETDNNPLVRDRDPGCRCAV